MKKLLLFIMAALFLGQEAQLQQPRQLLRVTPQGKGRIDTRIDNMGYWMEMVKRGYVYADTSRPSTPARFTGTQINLWQSGESQASDGTSAIPPQNSPDIPVTGESDVTQSENSVFIDPSDEYTVLNSNNSSSWETGFAQDLYGADALWSKNQGSTWMGSTAGVNGINKGDPATAIGLNGWWYIGKIAPDNGQAVSYSKNQGQSWTRVRVAYGPTAGVGLLDKNHLWIDNSPASIFKGYLYDAWTNFIPGSPDTNQVQIARSADQGLTWSSPLTISQEVNALKLNHGVNIHTGPGGEVYVAWSIYDTWPSDETAIGFTKSIDGGGIFMPSARIISNLKGIRASLTSKYMRVHAFPSMAVDNSTGPHRGRIYIVFPNRGYPGINTGNDIDIYLISSSDGGTSWSAPLRVNQDPPGLGKQHFFPWITCDPVTGGLCVIYYDDRQCDTAEVATFVSYSYDGGLSWSDMQVSDHIFTPEPISGLTFSYFGDYIGIQSNNMKVYPVWTDNHAGARAMSYVSPFSLGPNPGQPWVLYYSDSLASAGGAGPSNLNFGDSLLMFLKLVNIGDQPVGDLAVQLSSKSPYIVITDSISLFSETIQPDEVGTSSDHFTIKVSDTIPDNQQVRFDLLVSSPDSSWKSHFALLAHAPGPLIRGMTIIDTLDGNRNGRLDAGETVKIMVSTMNTGDFVMPSAIGRLQHSSPFLTLGNDSVNLGNIPPLQVKNAVFDATVSDLAPVGSRTDLLFSLSSGNYLRKKMFRQVIGLVAEDWESNTMTQYPWQTGGHKPWDLTTQSPWEGSYCLRSGAITNYQNSQFFLTYTSSVDDSISFYVKTSSEQDYDYVLFSINGIWQGQWSGNTPWKRVSFPVSSGTNTFKWIYLKDLSYASGEDCAWIDFITFPPPVLPVVDPGADETICAGAVAPLVAQVSNYDSLVWTTSGDGHFLNDSLPSTEYTPGPLDVTAGSVRLRLTAFGTYGSSIAEKSIFILALPAVGITSFPGDSVCAGQAITLWADTAGISTFFWTPGNFSGSVAVYDTSVSGGTGQHRIRLAVAGRNGCQNSDSVLIAFKDCTGLEQLQEDEVRVRPNPGHGIITIEIPATFGPMSQLTLVNDLGEAVFTKSSFREDEKAFIVLDTSLLPPGFYILKLRSERSEKRIKLILR